jgi:hypothetical protein
LRIQALEALERANISTTLVVTLKKGVNDGEIADITYNTFYRPGAAGNAALTRGRSAG